MFWLWEHKYIKTPSEYYLMNEMDKAWITAFFLEHMERRDEILEKMVDDEDNISSTKILYLMSQALL